MIFIYQIITHALYDIQQSRVADVFYNTPVQLNCRGWVYELSPFFGQMLTA